MRYNLHHAHFNMKSCRPPAPLVRWLDSNGWIDWSDRNDAGLSFRSPCGRYWLWLGDKNRSTRELPHRYAVTVRTSSPDVSDDEAEWTDTFACEDTSELLAYLASL